MKKTISKGPKITFSELMKEAERLKPVVRSKIILTDEQRKFILYCRDKKKPPLSYQQILDLWMRVDGWREVTVETIRSYYKKIKAGRI